MIVRASLGVNTLAELIALSKKGTKLTYGSPGIGTSPHISGAILNHAAGINITHVPYRGLGPALNDIVGGHIDAITTSVIGVLPYVQGGTARALATFDTERSDRLPDVPTTVELGFPDLVMPQWYGLLAPAGLVGRRAQDVRGAGAGGAALAGGGDSSSRRRASPTPRARRNCRRSSTPTSRNGRRCCRSSASPRNRPDLPYGDLIPAGPPGVRKSNLVAV